MQAALVAIFAADQALSGARLLVILNFDPLQYLKKCFTIS